MKIIIITYDLLNLNLRKTESRNNDENQLSDRFSVWFIAKQAQSNVESITLLSLVNDSSRQ